MGNYFLGGRDWGLFLFLFFKLCLDIQCGFCVVFLSKAVMMFLGTSDTEVEDFPSLTLISHFVWTRKYCLAGIHQLHAISCFVQRKVFQTKQETYWRFPALPAPTSKGRMKGYIPKNCSYLGLLIPDINIKPLLKYEISEGNFFSLLKSKICVGLLEDIT